MAGTSETPLADGIGLSVFKADSDRGKASWCGTGVNESLLFRCAVHRVLPAVIGVSVQVSRIGTPVPWHRYRVQDGPAYRWRRDPRRNSSNRSADSAGSWRTRWECVLAWGPSCYSCEQSRKLLLEQGRGFFGAEGGRREECGRIGWEETSVFHPFENRQFTARLI
jgi:hypothetical protein